MVTKQDIKQMLADFGIAHDGVVMMHSSMRSTGGVEGGCDAVIDACKEYLCDGLFIVPSHTWDRVKEANPVFDVRTTMPCTGALTTVAVGRPDGVRSLHPTHSIVAFGPRAAEYVRGEEKCETPCPAGGCWARLYDEGAKILLVGVNQNRNTYIHAVDEMLELPDRLAPPIELTIRDADGKEHTVMLRRHRRTGSENFPNYTAPFEKLGAVTYGRLGDAVVACCDARECTHILKHIWAKADHNLVAAPEVIPESYYEDYVRRES